MSEILVRPLAEADLPEADRINRIAFGTFFGLEDPTRFRGDGDVVHGRFRANPDGAFAAEIDGRLVGCGFVMDWGSAGILGPLTVDVELWSRGIARAMMVEMTAWMDRRGFALQGLFTHPQSPKHVRLYETFGFELERITGVMDKQVAADAVLADGVRLYSQLDAAGQAAALEACRAVAGSVYPGLDLSREIGVIADMGLGDTLLIARDGAVCGLACCHHGAMSEAGSAQAVVKFAAVRSGPRADADFASLLAACEGFAAACGVTRLVAGTSSARAECYRAMQAAGFRTWMNGVAMLRAGAPGYNRPDAFAIDDWR